METRNRSLEVAANGPDHLALYFRPAAETPREGNREGGTVMGKRDG